MARVGVLFFKQASVDRPWYHISRTKAKTLVQSGTHTWISKSVIHELVECSTPQGEPSRFFEPKLNIIPLLANPLADQGTMCLYYPVKDQSNYADEFGSRQDWDSFPEQVNYRRINL